jgi:hypothetical protein
MWFRDIPTFRRNIWPLSSRSKSKPRKDSAEAGGRPNEKPVLTNMADHMRLQLLSLVIINFMVFSGVTPCIVVDCKQRFGGRVLFIPPLKWRKQVPLKY